MHGSSRVPSAREELHHQRRRAAVAAGTRP